MAVFILETIRDYRASTNGEGDKQVADIAKWLRKEDSNVVLRWTGETGRDQVVTDRNESTGTCM